MAGEQYVDVQAGKIETQIREANDKLLGLIIKEAGDAVTSAKTAHDEATAASGASGKAQGKADAVGEEAHKLDRELLAAKTQLDAVDTKRAEVQKSLENLAICNAPRVIPFWVIGGSKTKTSVDPLRQFAGFQAIIEVVPEPEARRAAFNLSESLTRAGWNVISLTERNNIDDGVQVIAFEDHGSPGQTIEQRYSSWQTELRSMGMADHLVDFLHLFDWQAKRSWATDRKPIPPNSVRILVGLYPPVTFVSPPGDKDLVEATAQFEKMRAEMTHEMDVKRQKEDEKFLKNRTPQEIEEFKAFREKLAKERKTLEERYSSHCKPLSPLTPSF